MFGTIPEISPRTFLRAQVLKLHREKWDRTMGAMETIDHAAGATIDKGEELSQDLIYYRTLWPWPLKDRDYTLARRCKIFPSERAAVFVAVEFP